MVTNVKFGDYLIEEQKTVVTEGFVSETTYYNNGEISLSKDDDNPLMICYSAYSPKECVHEIEILKGTKPTCTENGSNDGERCILCDYCVPPTIVPALGHNETIIDAVNPSCTSTGLSEGIVCSVCNAVIKEQEVIPATGHDIIVLELVEPTYTEDGFDRRKCIRNNCNY